LEAPFDPKQSLVRSQGRALLPRSGHGSKPVQISLVREWFGGV
jgi:hypothetical protein